MATRQTSSFSFYCRPSKADKKGLAPIELSIIINGERTYIKLNRKERPEEFKQAMASKKDNPIKVYCENQRILVNDFVDRMAFEKIPVTSEALKDCIKRGYVSSEYTLGDLWRDIIENKRNELSLGDLDADTYRKYILARDAFYEANGFDENTFAHIVDIQHISVFQSFLRGRFKQPTAYNYHSRAKAAFTLAFQRGKIHRNPYAGFRMNKGRSPEKVWLTEHELNIIASKELVSDRLNKIRDAFLFQCYSGLSFSDLELLKKEDYKEKDGRLVVEKQRVKTGVKFTSVILKEGRELLEKYDYSIPVLTNQKYNAYLKEIQDACGLEKTLHSHLGRTTYVCYLYNRGVDPEVIASLVGHTTCKTTLKYYAEMDKTTIIDAVKRAEQDGSVADTSVETKAVPHEGSAALSRETIIRTTVLLETKPIFDFIAELENRRLVKHSRTELSESDLRKYYSILKNLEQEFNAAVSKCLTNNSEFRAQLPSLINKFKAIKDKTRRQFSKSDLRNDIRTQLRYVTTLSTNAIIYLESL